MKTFNQFVMEANDACQNITEDAQQDFYARIYRQAKAAGDKFPHLVAAQASLESGYGKSPSGKNNYFGQKASAGEAGTVKGTQEFGGGGMYDTSAKFKDYEDELEGIKTRMKNWSYKYGDAKDEIEAARRLQLPGGAEIPGSKEKSHGAYATDPNYTTKLSDVMSRFKGGVSDDTPTSASKLTPSRSFTKTVIADKGGKGGTVSTNTAYQAKLGGKQATVTRGETGTKVIRSNLGVAKPGVKDQKVAGTLGGQKGTIEIKGGKKTFTATVPKPA
jgi:hypothetical protein